MLLPGALVLAAGCLAVSAIAQNSKPASQMDPLTVNATNWYWGPANTWSWHNTRRIFPTAPVSRGVGPVVALAHEDRDLDQIAFIDPITKKPMTAAGMLDATFTDGFLVLHHGQIVAESYRNGMTADDPHMLMSVSKSVMGTLAGILAGRGQLDPGRLVTAYVPEMQGTVYEGATVRNLLDMSVEDPIERAAFASAEGTAKAYEAVDEAGGWLPATATTAPGLRAYLTGLHRPHGENGKQFLYLDQSAILMGWVMERAAGKELSALLAENLWSKLGAEHDGYMLLDHYQQSYSSAGFNATLRDLARFGQMMAQGGSYNGQQIVPAAWVKDIQTNGASSGKGESGPGAPANYPGHRHGVYRSFWWVTEKSCGRFTGIGLGGQLLVVDPVADMVVVKFDSVPTPEQDEATFATEYAGIDAIVQAISGHGCS
jgi:CubicO group peptidase (beta-lactamase class C family)